MSNLDNICRLCKSCSDSFPINGVDERRYYLCEQCCLITVGAQYLPNAEEEKKRYLTHQNGIQFAGYVDFLHRAIDPALQYMRKGMLGLDYGCGPVPTLSKLLQRAGYACEDYDPFFVNHDLNKKFEFIFSTEVFEHFFNPGDEINRIRGLLGKNGILIVMTERWNDPEQFSEWYYAKDNSHVSFYHSRTFDYICERFGFKKLFDDGHRVAVLQYLG